MSPARAARPGARLLRLAALALLAAIAMECLHPGRFATGRNFASMAFQCPELGILSLAVMLSLVTGGIDLSVVSVANLSGILAGLAMEGAAGAAASGGLAVAALGVAAALGAGLACGALNGFLVARLRVPPILATLGTLQAFFGFALVITKGAAVEGYPEEFLAIGNAAPLGIPAPLLVFAALAAGTAFALHRTRFGVSWALVGSNPTAARFSGIRIERSLFAAYALSGLLSGAAGAILMARTNSAKADYGASYLLQAILVAILGGANPSGGSGSVAGVAVALAALQFLSSGFTMLRVNLFLKELSWGAFLLAAMVIERLSERAEEKRAARR